MSDDAPLFDPTDSLQVGMALGLMGGTTADAAQVAFACAEFERRHGRKPTSRDVGLLIGLVRERGS